MHVNKLHGCWDRCRGCGQCIEVSTVIDRWLTPEHRYFKVKGDDGRH